MRLALLGGRRMISLLKADASNALMPTIARKITK
jgi:hypothetical protein